MKNINRYKAFLIKKLQTNTESELSVILKGVNEFLLTDEGKKGFLFWEIKQLRTKRRDPIRRLGMELWDVVDKTNPIASQDINF